LQFPIKRRGAFDHNVDNVVDVLGKEAADITAVGNVRRAFISGRDSDVA